MTNDEGADISPRMQAVARLTASVLVGLVAFSLLTLAVPSAGWEIAREPSPFAAPAEGTMYFNEWLAAVAFLVTYMVLSFWAAMEPQTHD